MVQNSGSFKVSVNERQSIFVLFVAEMFDSLSVESLSSRWISEPSQLPSIFAAVLLSLSPFGSFCISPLIRFVDDDCSSFASVIPEHLSSFHPYLNPFAKFFFLPWFCRFITSHPVSQPSVSYSALNFDLIRSIHRQLGTMVLGKVRLLLSCGKISLAVVEQAWKNITKHKQLVNKLRLTFHDQVKILRQNF